MGKTLKLVSPIPPSVNHYLAYRAVIKHGKPLAMSYKTPEAVKYRKEFAEYVASEVNKQGYNLPLDKNQHFYIDAVFYFPKIDLDPNNYFKVMLDAITDTQLIWVDDNVTCERVQAIYYDSNNPRVEIEIKPVDYIGLFKNKSQMNKFIKSFCIGCTRYKRNCSILQKAKEGRIQECMDGESCSEYKQVKK